MGREPSLLLLSGPLVPDRPGSLSYGGKDYIALTRPALLDRADAAARSPIAQVGGGPSLSSAHHPHHGHHCWPGSFVVTAAVVVGVVIWRKRRSGEKGGSYAQCCSSDVPRARCSPSHGSQRSPDFLFLQLHLKCVCVL
ncbi:hypothetical protein Cadr_000022157 [Camelus dromedarius]|uniref:Uncharacterized protein n=1 Tax=Camelus dromedarius TaxID=9838 RepID=A0A5N4CS64_CAMDR|nr:hypothetical protein Cadr_000022157 [Camelus dromedarius]